MRLQCLVAITGFVYTALGNPSKTEDYQGPTVSTKNGTYGGIYLPTYDQDLFLGVRYAQVSHMSTFSPPLNSVSTESSPFQESRAYQ